ncbi:MAG: tetratricopeptide repeat protein [Saprospiraceae bacterium]|jgi:tetratricopeptide (TPR) repeat protein|nr:tetratricopeptide repeat protein [Saprospiraceae bacterium]
MKDNRLELLLDMLKKDPEDSFVRYAIAKEYESLSDYQASLNHFLILKMKDPNYVGMYYHLAKLYEKQENLPLAIQTYDEGIAVAKKIPDFHALSELNSARINLEMEM